MNDEPRDEASHMLVQVVDAHWDELVQTAAAFMANADVMFVGLSVDELHAAAEATATCLRDSLSGEAASARHLEVVRRIATQRAREGFDLRVLIRGVHGSIDGFVDQLSGLVHNGRTTMPKVLFDLVTHAISRAQVRIDEAMIDGYEAGRLDTVDPDDAPAVRLVDEVLGFSHPYPTQETIRAAAEMAGVNPDGPWLTALLVGRRADATRLRAAARDAAAAWEGACPGAVLREPVLHVPVLAPVADEASGALAVQRLAGAVAEHQCFLLPSNRLSALHEAGGMYADARSSAPWAYTVPARGAVLDSPLLFQVRVVANTDARDRAREFEEALGALVRGGHRQLQEFLDVLVAVGEQQAAAEYFGKDKSWATRQMDKIADITGRSWDDNWGRFTMTSAVLCRWIAAADNHSYSVSVYGPAPDLARLWEGIRP